MIIGVAKEIKNNENRVGLTPAGTEALVKAGHQVLIEKSAGIGSGFTDDTYTSAGAEIVADKKALFDRSEMIVKVKEPLAEEYDLFHEGQTLFTYLHLAPEPELTKALLKHKVTGIAYETIVGRNNTLPLLAPMSEIARRSRGPARRDRSWKTSTRSSSAANASACSASSSARSSWRASTVAAASCWAA